MENKKINDKINEKEFKKVMIHGRFQPFTIGHMQHLKRVLKRTSDGTKVFVGITKPFLELDAGVSTGDDHRDNKSSNPYTYEERKDMVLRSVAYDEETSHRLKDITVIPWPLNNLQELQKIIDEYMPDKDVLQYMNIIPGDGWEYEKRETFESLGFKTLNIVDPIKPRITSATEVRTLKSQKGNWQSKVPEGTREVLEEINRFSFRPKDLANLMLPRTPDATEMAQEMETIFRRLEEREEEKLNDN